MDNFHDTHGKGWHNNRAKWVLIGFLAVAAFFLWAEHRTHVLGILPYLLVLACSLMHLFHHHGHGTSPDAGEPSRQPRQMGDQR